MEQLHAPLGSDLLTENYTGGLDEEDLEFASGILSTYQSPDPLDVLSDATQPKASELFVDPFDIGQIEATFHQDIGSAMVFEEKDRSSPGLPRRRSRYYIRKYGGGIVTGPTSPNFQFSDSLMRWQQSPPEEEPAALSAVEDAVRKSLVSESMEASLTLDNECTTADFENRDVFRIYRQPRSQAASTTSGESATSVSSRQSSDFGRSKSSRGAVEKKTRNRSRNIHGGSRKDKDQSGTKNTHRPFCCTFCCDKFKNKHDWMRHEKSLHLNLENWVCAPFGGRVVMQSTGRTHCAYCNMLDPSAEHLAEHNHSACEGQEYKRIFRRKDHLVQHLRVVHHLTTVPLIADWKTAIGDFTSRCGFCDVHMTSWSERGDHLALHFRQGLTMANWKGDHEFPPEIACHVTRAVPPYLINLESETLVPFSATNSQVEDHFSQMLSRATFGNDVEADADGSHQQKFPKLPDILDQIQSPPDSSLNSYTQILTLQLCHYAEEQSQRGIPPTDGMFQREARRLLFDSDDPWNQTIADQPEWLAAFREQHLQHLN
ncbi:hypothetical protein FE257_007916 [Aspergillus nanangensis]|uniref:C2H2-type domain-containing protein n=1 Tax=Aspergillus nanangensis TaxID=2582783 RepID=A0AAD4CXR8_ASPNN|nr:hypothetical protein FE257_007916 [Aspergillus nanangensis]